MTTIPIMTAYKPIADAKIITMSMLMKVAPFYEVTSAVLEPNTPTQIPHTTFDTPTQIPIQKAAWAEF